MKPEILRLPIGDDAPTATLYYGISVLEGLRLLKTASVHTIVTSPPYWGLRDYGVPHHPWPAVDFLPMPGLPPETTLSIPDQTGCLGLEPDLWAYVGHLVAVFRELRRVLREDGTVWLNLGDSYQSSKGVPGGSRRWKTEENDDLKNPARRFGLRPQDMVSSWRKPKDLCFVPERVVLALQAEGWYVRAKIPWVKRSAMPGSQQDRPTVATEWIYLLAHPDSGGRYFYDQEAVKEASSWSRKNDPKWGTQRTITNAKKGCGNRNAHSNGMAGWQPSHGRIRRDSDWFYDSITALLAEKSEDRIQGLIEAPESGHPIAFCVNPRPFKSAHFAVFPPTLVKPMIQASTSKKGVCEACGTPWLRHTTRSKITSDLAISSRRKDLHGPTYRRHSQSIPGGQSLVSTEVVSSDWEPGCECGASIARASILDPFSGSGTTGMVALQEGRNYIGIDLNPDYLPLAKTRILGKHARVSPKQDSESLGGILDLL